MKLTESITSILEAVDYKKTDEDTHGSYELQAKSSYGDISISVYVGGSVYLVEVGKKRLIDASDDDDTVSISQAKNIVDLYLKSRKFNVEKWLNSSKYISKMLSDMDSGKFNKPFDGVSSALDVVNKILERIITEVTYYGGYANLEVPPLSDDLVVNFMSSDKAKKIIFSKVSRLVLNGSGEFNKRLKNFNFGDFKSDKGSDAILDKVIDKILIKKGISYEDDFFAQMMGQNNVRKSVLKLKGLTESITSILEAKKYSAKQAEKEFEKLFKKHGSGVQFDIMNLAKLSDPVEKEIMSSGDLAKAEEMLKELIAKYREN